MTVRMPEFKLQQAGPAPIIESNPIGESASVQR